MAVFDWCAHGQHDKCIREYQRFHIVPNRKRGGPSTKVELLDEFVKCECPKRGCECYVKAADRTKKTKRKRKS